MFCWDQGIAVVEVSQKPRPSRSVTILNVNSKHKNLFISIVRHLRDSG